MKRRQFSKQKIYDTSNFCTYCGGYIKEWEKIVDHFLPYAHYECNSNDNLFVSCRECNAIKSDKVFSDIYEAILYILPIKAERGVKIKPAPKSKIHKERPQKACQFCGGLATTKYCSSLCRHLRTQDNFEGIYKILNNKSQHPRYDIWKKRLHEMWLL